MFTLLFDDKHAGHNGVNLVTREAYHSLGTPKDDHMIDEWIANGGKFGTAKTTKRGSRRDKNSSVDQKKSAESVKGKATANSSKKRGRSDKTKPKSKLTKEQKKKELALLELKRRELELMGSSSSDEDEDEDQPPKKQKGAVQAACEELQKEMDSDDSDDETVGVVVEA